MGLFAPWFLAGALAAGLPVYLHLLRRHSTTPLPFSSLMFFEARTQSSIKHRRLRYLLLLAVRMALLILLALAFANPFIYRSAASMASDKLLLVVVDDSFSMRAGTRLADAKRDALSLLGSKAPNERAQVVALASQLHELTQPTLDPAVLREAVNSIEPGDERANFGELASAMRSLSESVRTPVELHLFSDMQKTAMPASFSELALPGNFSLALHPVVKEAMPNWTVESVDAPGEVWDPKKSRVQAVIAGYNTPEAKRTVSLVVAGKTVATTAVDVPANGRATAQFDSLDVPYGLTRCEVRIDSADSLPADDSSLFAVERTDPQRVLFVHDGSDSRSLLYFSAALAAGAEAAFNMDSVTVDKVANVDPSRFAFVVLSDTFSLPASFEDALNHYVRGGGNVLIATGTSATRKPRVPVFGGNVLDTRNYSMGNERFLTVGDVDPAFPAIEKADHWAGVKFYFVARVDDTGSRVIARLTDQTPLLLEKKVGEGRVLFFGSGLDNLTNDFPLHPDFVPFVEQTARYLTGITHRSGSRVVDSFLELRTAKEQAVSVEVVDPDGKRPLSLQEATSAQSYQLTRAGFYQLRLADGRQDLVGVNADRRESDLDVMTSDVQALWRGDSSTEQQKAATPAPVDAPEQEKKPYGLWWYLLLFVLVTALAQSFLSSGYLGVQREEP